MSKCKHARKFSPEQISILKDNPFTYKVTARNIWFTLEFKNLFMSRFEYGDSSREIFEDCGYDFDILGSHRVYGYPKRLREQLRNGAFTEGAPNQTIRADSDVDYNTKPAIQSVAAMQRELSYLRQQVEFLKKITELDNGTK